MEQKSKPTTIRTLLYRSIKRFDLHQHVWPSETEIHFTLKVSPSIPWWSKVILGTSSSVGNLYLLVHMIKDSRSLTQNHNALRRWGIRSCPIGSTLILTNLRQWTSISLATAIIFTNQTLILFPPSSILAVSVHVIFNFFVAEIQFDTACGRDQMPKGDYILRQLGHGADRGTDMRNKTNILGHVD